MTEYSNEDRVAIFKNDSDNEKAPHWSGQVVLSPETIAGIGEDGIVRLALWKTYKGGDTSNSMFLAGKAELPYREEGAPASAASDDDDF